MYSKTKLLGLRRWLSGLESLAFKHEDPSSNPSTHIKSLVWLPVRQSVLIRDPKVLQQILFPRPQIRKKNRETR